MLATVDRRFCDLVRVVDALAMLRARGKCGPDLAIWCAVPLIRDPLVEIVIACAIEVHRHLGPGLLESAYQRCLAHELKLRGVGFTVQERIPLVYKGLSLDCGYRVDLVIERRLVVELKMVDHILPVHTAQLLTYVRLLGAKQGLLLNFHAARLVDGLRSVVL
jgi:GxxExxY protein